MAEQLPPHRINPAVYAEAERFTDGRITTEVLATCAHRMGVPLYVDIPEPGEKLMGLSDFLAKPQPTPRVDPFKEALDIAGDALPLDAPPIPKPGHVTPFVHDSPEWHALRARHIGGSEVAALFDAQPAYALSKFALWQVKKGNAKPPPVGNERVTWGLLLEEAIAKGVSMKCSWAVRKGGYVADPTTVGLGCTLDYEIETDPDEDGRGALELKNVDWMIHKRQWGDEPPLHILLQHQHQLAATGYSWGAVGALVGGNDLHIYRYRARPKLIDEIRRRVADFWASIDRNEPPDPDGSDGAMNVLRQLYPETVDDGPIDMTSDNELPGLCATVLTLSKDRIAREKDEKNAKAKIMAKLGAHRRAICEGFAINLQVTPENPGRPALPDEIIGKRAEVRKVAVKEWTI